MFVTETKLSAELLTSAYFKTPGYIAYRKDRINQGRTRSGGVIILVNSDIVSEEIISPTWKYIEIVACILHFGNKSVLAACIYRPPKIHP